MLWCKIALYIIDTHGVQNMFKKCFDVKIALYMIDANSVRNMFKYAVM